MNKQLEEKLIIILDNHIDFAEWATSASEQTELLEELSTLINKCEEDIFNKVEVLIAEEMNIANQEGQPTSRLTSLGCEISNLKSKSGGIKE